MVRSILLVGLGSAFSIGTSFVRGVILARVLGAEQFGVAVILISIAAALDIFADAGIDKYVVRSRFGYRADVMRTSHAFRFAGSALLALAIVALAYPLALLFQAPDMWLAIAATGGVIFLRGLVNLDYKLQQREGRFEAEMRIDIARSAADLAVAALVAMLTQSYWAVIAALYANAIVHLVWSHAVAAHGYSFRPRRALVGLVGKFSTPIYLNAALLFAAVQGDRWLAAALFPKAELARYAVSLAIGQGLVALATRVMTNTLLPVFAAPGTPVATQRTKVNRAGLLIIAGSMLFAVALGLLGGPLVALIYGPDYAGLGLLILASAVAQMIQLEQGWLTTLLMARGMTAEFPKITIVRAAALPAAFGFVALGYSIVSIPLALAVGSVLSLIVSYRAARRLGVIDSRLAVLSFARIAFALAIVAALARQAA